ncbi:MAG: cytochrome c oxidase subunit II [Alteripontixanthobacter sp.]
MRIVLAMALAAILALGISGQASAQDIMPAAEPVAVDEPVSAAISEDEPSGNEIAAGSYTPMGPEMIKGQPTDSRVDPIGAMGFQKQYTDDGEYALWMHNAILLPVIFAISLFVLALILWVVARYRRKANPVPSKTTHNTLIEVLWTLIPVGILVWIAIPSITLLARQYETPPENAVTIKATGYQWYWGYTYPDNGGFEIISNMMPEDEAIAKGLPGQLAVDNRMVVPANTPLRIQTTGADVIHAFGVPSLWFKIDAVPGRLNERLMTIKEPGIYYGQCMELCGPKHAYMPIAIEALPRAQWEQWVLAQGGTIGGDAESVEEEATDGDGQQPEGVLEVGSGSDNQVPEVLTDDD